MPSTCWCGWWSAWMGGWRWSWCASRRSTTGGCRRPGRSTSDGHAADASGAGQVLRLATDLSLGIEGSAVRGRHRLVKGERAFCRAVLGRRPGRSGRRGGRCVADRGHRAVLAGVAGPGAHPGPPVAAPGGAVGVDDQGADVHADRGDGGGVDHVAARDPRRGAELGLPVLVDAGHDVHVAGVALPEPGLGGRRVHAVRRRPRAQPRRWAADHVRHRRAPGPERVHP